MIAVTFGKLPPTINLKMDGREPYIIRDQGEAWRLINLLCLAYQQIFEERKSKDD